MVDGGAESAANEAIERGVSSGGGWPTDYGGGRRYSGGMIQPDREGEEEKIEENEIEEERRRMGLIKGEKR